jgi:3-hydroxyisobutyrate dehydrogenase-like beta-hydroxyacid dehydrogenase
MKESTTDVLIIGAGPAGLMLANWLSKTGISTRIIDRRPSKITVGHADGFQCRTVEVFQSFGIAHRVIAEGNELAEVVFYKCVMSLTLPLDPSNILVLAPMPMATLLELLVFQIPSPEHLVSVMSFSAKRE